MSMYVYNVMANGNRDSYQIDWARNATLARVLFSIKHISSTVDEGDTESLSPTNCSPENLA